MKLVEGIGTDQIIDHVLQTNGGKEDMQSN